METFETEVKFYLSDIKTIRQRISDLKAQSHGRFFEKNLRFEDAHKTLKTKKFLLRLRRDNLSTLVFKSPLAECDHEVKKNEGVGSESQ
jgi:adenylate cyclase class IV